MPAFPTNPTHGTLFTDAKFVRWVAERAGRRANGVGYVYKWRRSSTFFNGVMRSVQQVNAVENQVIYVPEGQDHTLIIYSSGPLTNLGIVRPAQLFDGMVIVIKSSSYDLSGKLYFNGQVTPNGAHQGFNLMGNSAMTMQWHAAQSTWIFL
jgi:hypothetical protein